MIREAEVKILSDGWTRKKKYKRTGKKRKSFLNIAKVVPP
jgi:hypothetical protein